MSLGREHVVQIEATWADGSGAHGTGFVIRVGKRTALVTALHVVANVGGLALDWAKIIVAERFGEVTPAEFDLSDDWVVFDVDAAAAEPTLRAASAMLDDCHAKVSTYGFPCGALGLHGTLVSTDVPIRWSHGGQQHEVSRMQVFLHELAAGLDLRGVSGGPLGIGKDVVGVVQSFLPTHARGYASGTVLIHSKTPHVRIAAGVRLTSSDGVGYVVARTTALMDAQGTEVPVLAERAGAVANMIAGEELRLEQPILGVLALAEVTDSGISGGEDELPSPVDRGSVLGGIAFITPIGRILTKLGVEPLPLKTQADQQVERILRLPRPRKDGMRAQAPEPPSYWLRAAQQKIEFDLAARERELDILERLCFGDDTEVQAFVGPGGTGKTRLLIYWCERLRAQGWLAGFLQQGDAIELLEAGHLPRLVVIDYVERDPETARQILKRMRSQPSPSSGSAPPKIRLVLLAREAGQWARHLAEYVLESDRVTMSAAYGDQESRRSAFERAIVGFGCDPTAYECPDLMTRTEYDRPLYVQTRAMLAILGESTTEDPLKSIVAQEREAWHRTFAAQHRGGVGAAAERALDRAVTGLALCGGATSVAKTRLILQHVRIEVDDVRIMDCLQALYPIRDNDEGITALEPDLLAEQLVFERLSCANDEEVDEWLKLPFVVGGAGAAALDLLNRVAAERGGSNAGRWIAQMLLANDRSGAPRCKAMIQAIANDRFPSTVEPKSATLLDAVRLAKDIDLAMCVSDAIPVDTVELAEVAEAGAQLLVEHFRSSAPTEQNGRYLALALAKHGVRLNNLGKRDEALRATEDSVGVCRELVKINPDVFRPLLAQALTNLGGGWRAVGDWKSGLSMARESVQVYRELTNRYLPGLASALSNLSVMLSDAKEWEDALRSNEEAVSVYRDLVAMEFGDFRHGLTMALSNRGAWLSQLGNPASARPFLEEAVDVLEELAETAPDRYLPGFGTALNNLALCLGELQRGAEARQMSERAVDVYRDLARTRPEAYLPDLVQYLAAHGSIILDVNGDYLDAISSFTEALRLIAPTYMQEPDTFTRLVLELSRYLARACEATGSSIPDDLAALVRPFLTMPDQPEV